MQLADTEQFLEYTQSLCSECLTPVSAQIFVRDGAVYMEKECSEHGFELVYLWPDAEHYRWMRTFQEQGKRSTGQGNEDKDCPHRCGLCKQHLNHSTLIELEVTQRCNMRCPVCFMSAEAVGKDPSLGKLEAVFRKILEQSGPDISIQLTGGEPTVRSDLPEVVSLARHVGFNSVEINTNGLIISRNLGFLQRLKDAGASGIYMQFDGLDDIVYQATRGQDIYADKLQAIANCRDIGLQIVLAMTIIRNINEKQIGDVIRFALDNIDVVVGVALQPAFSSGRFDAKKGQGLTMGNVVHMLSEQTDGLIKPREMWPLSCSHPLCSSGTQLVWHENSFVPATRLITREDYKNHVDSNSPQGSVFADVLVHKEGSSTGGLSVMIMNYMDVHSFDIKRLKECSMTVAQDDGRLVPFCAYQLTNEAGKRLYEPWILNDKKTDALVV